MKKYKFLIGFLILSFGYIGCEQNEIALYNESPRINFLWNAQHYTFRDTDYVNGHEFHDLDIEVEIQGYLLKTPLDFVVKSQAGKAYETTAEIVLPQKYTYTALDTNKQWIVFKVKRPAKLTPTNEPEGAILKFDLDNPAHQFASGRVDIDSCRIEVYYDITPTGAIWNATWWGEYSTGKYFFMMDYFKTIYKDMDRGRLAELKQAYEEYKQAHAPILDDGGKEIAFPN
ncbi:hypothetical protein [uncultured Sanguibacteroides sp.]|uniref:hypothetical protein n=1 Tax=uncultured Sanguibacteroides sp. TaxID=1635151 RepID=UPI0025CE8F05|nr:hypothetical protein [uncultured Sanguibacteroides sp.]